MAASFLMNTALLCQMPTLKFQLAMLQSMCYV